MISSPQDQIGICRTHNLKQEFLNPDKSNRSQKFVCQLCVNQFFGIIHVQEAKESYKEIIQMFSKQSQQNSEILSQVILSLVQVQQDYIKSTNIITSIIDKLKNQILENESEIVQLINSIELLDEIQMKHQNYIEKLKNLLINTEQELKVLNKNYGIDKLLSNLNQLNLKSLNYEQKQKNIIQFEEVQNNTDIDQFQVKELNVKAKQYQYERINQPSIYQGEWCQASAFNQDGSIFVAGCITNIIVFEFKKEQLKKINTLYGLRDNITTLQFMKKSNQLISGSNQGSIKIWSYNMKNQWMNIQDLREHNDQIICLVINKDENLIISGSSDTLINFFQLINKAWSLHSTISCSSSVFSLSLNDSSTYLISNEANQIIQIIERSKNQWKITQQINNYKNGDRISFITDDEFAFLYDSEDKLHFYKKNYKTNQFQKSYEVNINGSMIDNYGFPIKFIQSKNILIVKHGKYINILRKNEDEKFVVDQSIEFKSNSLFGNVSEDGQFLITWDDKSEEYQIRKLKEVM